LGRLKGCLWLTAGLVVALLAGAVAFITLQGAVPGPAVEDAGVSGATVPVVVASRPMEVRSQLAEDDLEVKALAPGLVPEGAISDVEEAIGKITLVDLYLGEIILAQRLVDPNVITGDGRLALVVAEDEVLLAFPIQDLMSRIGILKPGDHIDLLYSLWLPTGEEGDALQVTFGVLENVTIAQIVRDTTAGGQEGTNVQAILMTVDPQDALQLKFAKDAGGIVDIVLRAPGVEGPFDTEPVDVDYMINRYRIPTWSGQ
jgi:pilus assembly protein CpaB